MIACFYWSANRTYVLWALLCSLGWLGLAEVQAQSRSVAQQRIDSLIETAFRLKTSAPTEGLRLTQQALELAEEQNYLSGQADALHTTGMLYWYQGLNQYAFEHYLQAMQLREQTGDSLGLGRSYQNLGLVMQWLGRDSAALRYFQQSLAVRQAIGDSVGMIYALVNLADQHRRLAPPDQGDILSQYDQALRLARLIDNRRAEAYVHSHIGEICMNRAQWQSAQQHIQEAMRICQTLQDRNGYCRNEAKLGRVLLALGQPQQALTALEDARIPLEDLKALTQLIEVFQLEAQALQQLDRWEEAYQAQVRLREIEQARNQRQADVALSMLQLRHDTQQKDREIALLREEEENYRLRLSVLAMVLVLLVLGALAAFFLISFRSQRRISALLRDQQAVMQQKNTELARSNAELADFAHAASHDLKEPLRTISSYAGLLERRYSPQLDDEASEYLRFLRQSTQHMWHLLDDLLVYARIGQQAERESVDLNQLLAHLREQLATQLASTQGQLTLHPVPTVRGHRSGLMRLFQNLISNGLKFYGERPPRVEVGAETVEAETRYYVRDHGIGIAPQHQARIFRAFQRLHAKERYPGTGLGLAIALKVVQQHGGRLWVESTPGQGSTFWFTLDG